MSVGFANEPKKDDSKKMEQHHSKHWGYSGDVGPANWGKLNKNFHMCSEGKEQTPIDVVPTKDEKLPPLDLNYTEGSRSIIDNGHAVQVNIKDGNTFNIDGVPYELKQFHFHTPSENHIKGISFPMEAHFVHASKDGNLAVIAVVFEEGDKNPSLEKIIESFPLEDNREKKLDISQADINMVMPKNREYYRFMGSLTTPPCSEQVKWFVFKNPQTATKAQLDAMHKEIGKENNRPIQPTNGRDIEE
jgi:carbonic anhydrase